MRFGILGFLIFAIAFVTDARADQRVALVIGNSAYQNVPKLPNPVNDARAVTALFKRAGFDVVESRPDLGISNLKRALRDFTDLAAQADVAVVYYAGHGIEVDGNNYLVPVDAVLERDVDVEDETVSVDRVLKALDPAKRLRLVILDACRDNPFARTMKRTTATRSTGAGLAKMEPLTSDTLIAFAARAGSTAMDGDGKNSPFTSALLKHLATPGLDVRLALGRVRDDVMKATSGKSPLSTVRSAVRRSRWFRRQIRRSLRRPSLPPTAWPICEGTTNFSNGSGPRTHGNNFCRFIRPVPMRC
jgi:uncharacterized caspase-like protein